MKGFVITITHNERSVISSNTTRITAEEQGLRDIEVFPAVTPKTGWKHILPYENKFNECMKPDSVGACFASHYLLWKKCIELDEPILILEHDAIVIDKLPQHAIENFDKCLNLGRPSYIRPAHMTYDEPKTGLQPLSQKHMMGHHAYAIRPEAAKIFVEDCKHRPLTPNDVWMDKDTYPWLQEYSPYPIVADTQFSTVQDNIPSFIKKNREEYVKYVQNDQEKYKYLVEHFNHCMTGVQSLEFIDADRDN